MIETPETRKKLADALRQLQARGDTASINRLVGAYKAKYQPAPIAPGKINPKTSTFNVAESPAQRANKLSKINAENTVLAKESERANSTLGKRGNFEKALVSNIAPSEVGLGKTISQLAGNNRDVYADAIQNTSSSTASLLKLIRAKEGRGEDATKQKQIYNDLIKHQGELTAALGEENDLPTTSKVVGQIGGTALDVLTAGTYGKAKTAGMEAFKLAPSASSLATKVATTAGLPELGKVGQQTASGLFTKKGAVNVLKGAGLGYASDVTLGLQGIRGEDRTGNKAFIPGFGTAIGASIPLISEINQSAKNARNPDLKMQKLQEKINKDVDGLLGSKSNQNKVKLYQQRNTNVTENIKDPNVFKGIKVENKRINPDEAIATIDARIDQILDAKQKILPEVDRVAPEITKAELKARALSSSTVRALSPADQISMAAAIDKQLDPLPNTLKASEVDKLRAMFRTSARNSRGLPLSNEYTALETATRNAVFDLTDNLPFDTSSTYKNLNNYVKTMIDTKEFLDKTLRGQTVKGGKLGEYVARTVGAIAGSHAGPLGAIMGSEVGGTISNIITNDQLGSSQKMKLISNLTDDPEILKAVDTLLKQAQDYTPPLLPAPTSTYRSQQKGTGTINLPAKSASTLEKEGIDRIQAQRSTPSISRQNTANTITNTAPIKAISDSIQYNPKNAIVNATPAEVIEKTFKNNVIMQLEDEGASSLSDKISKLDFSGASSADDISQIISDNIGKSALKNETIQRWISSTGDTLGEYAKRSPTFLDKFKSIPNQEGGFLAIPTKTPSIDAFIKSPSSFTLFRGETGLSGDGIHFTTDPSWAKQFGPNMKQFTLPKGARIYHLNISDMDTAFAQGIKNEDGLWSSIFKRGFDAIIGVDAMNGKAMDIIVNPKLLK